MSNFTFFSTLTLFFNSLLLGQLLNFSGGSLYTYIKLNQRRKERATLAANASNEELRNLVGNTSKAIQISAPGEKQSVA